MILHSHVLFKYHNFRPWGSSRVGQCGSALRGPSLTTGKTLKHSHDVHPNATAKIEPSLSYMCHIRSVAGLNNSLQSQAVWYPCIMRGGFRTLRSSAIWTCPAIHNLCVPVRVHNLWFRSKSGLDCLTCAIIARKRGGFWTLRFFSSSAIWACLARSFSSNSRALASCSRMKARFVSCSVEDKLSFCQERKGRHTYVYLYIYSYLYLYLYLYLHLYPSISIYLSIYIYLPMYLCIYVSMYLSIYLYPG